MKVLFLVSDANARGGTEILAYNLLDRLNSIGVDCYLLSRWQYKGDNPKVLSFSDVDFQKWLKISNSPINKLFGNVFSDRFFKKIFFRLASEFQVDWIINHTYDLIGAVPTADNIRSAQIFNWSVKGYEKNLKYEVSKKNIAVRILSKIALCSLVNRWHRSISRMDKLIVLSDAAQAEMKSICPKIEDSQLVTISDPLMQTTDSIHISNLKNKNIVFVGRLSQEKGVMRLLRIWKIISNRLPDYSLSIYGEGHMKDVMLRYIFNNDLGRIDFKGFEKDLEKIYSHADLCLMTSDTEGFGMVLIEAMYYGVPCVSFDCPVSPKEIIADAGVTVPCFDEDAYADAVVRLLQDPERLKNLQQKSIERARDFYIDKVIDKWMTLLNSKE